MEYILKVPDHEHEFIERLLQAFSFVELIPTTKPARKARPKDETEYLLSSPANAKALLAAIERLERGEGQEHDLIEV